MLKKSGLIFKSPVATVSPTRHRFTHYVYGQLTLRVDAIVLHTHRAIARSSSTATSSEKNSTDANRKSTTLRAFQ